MSEFSLICNAEFMITNCICLLKKQVSQYQNELQNNNKEIFN